MSMSRFLTGPVTVSVPATSANLGPGFDALGLALAHRDHLEAEVVDDAPGAPSITVLGEGAEQVPTDESHLVHRAMAEAFALMGRPVPTVRLHCDNVIPHRRGLGSSSAAIVSGICAARALVAGGSLLMDDAAVFELAARLEGHGDNVAPALYGGFTIAYDTPEDRHRCRAATVSVDPRVTTVVLVPPEGVETKVARALLPGSVSHADAALNAGRAALLVAALNRQPELLLDATEDRLHQHYRESAMPDTVALVDRFRKEGLAAVISGAGPAVLVFTDAAGQDQVADQSPPGWQALNLAIDPRGAVVTLPREG